MSRDEPIDQLLKLSRFSSSQPRWKNHTVRSYMILVRNVKHFFITRSYSTIVVWFHKISVRFRKILVSFNRIIWHRRTNNLTVRSRSDSTEVRWKLSDIGKSQNSIVPTVIEVSPILSNSERIPIGSYWACSTWEIADFQYRRKCSISNLN